MPQFQGLTATSSTWTVSDFSSLLVEVRKQCFLEIPLPWRTRAALVVHVALSSWMFTVTTMKPRITNVINIKTIQTVADPLRLRYVLLVVKRKRQWRDHWLCQSAVAQNATSWPCHCHASVRMRQFLHWRRALCVIVCVCVRGVRACIVLTTMVILPLKVAFLNTILEQNIVRTWKNARKQFTHIAP